MCLHIACWESVKVAARDTVAIFPEEKSTDAREMEKVLAKALHLKIKTSRQKKSSIWPEIGYQFWRGIKLGTMTPCRWFTLVLVPAKATRLKLPATLTTALDSRCKAVGPLAIVYSAKVLGNWINGPSPYLTIVMFRVWILVDTLLHLWEPPINCYFCSFFSLSPI